ncbi:MAG: hypothetical protein PHY34_01295 [Patescibacteria group bacterium]|nr:hypothetical protein [Patescibacteria group bacterium]MDD5715145.1 hypothetical protein [Patescibacteria group bacterium]
MINKQRIISKIPFLILILFCIVFSLFGIKEVYRIPYLYTLDPGFHYTITQALDAHNPLGTEVPTFGGGKIDAEYPSSMRTFLVAFHEVTDISYLDLFKLFGLFTRVFTVFIIFFVAAYLFKNKIVALIVSLLFLCSNYVFFRAIITFPENLVIPFHILVFYEVVKSIRNRKIQAALPIYCAASLLIHYPSAIILGIILFPFIFYIASDFVKNRTNRKKIILQIFVFILLLFIVSSPVLSNLINRYQRYAVNNVGETALTLISQSNSSKYIPISWLSLIKSIGPVTLFFAIIAACVLFFTQGREKYLLITWVVATFALTRGSQLHLFIPTARMLIYLLIPTIFLAGYGIKRLNIIHYPLVFICLFVFLVISLVVTVNNIHGGVAISNSQINQANWLNNNIDDNTVLLNSSALLTHSGFLVYNNFESRNSIYSELYKNDVLNADKLKKFYLNKRVFLAVNKLKSTLFFNQVYPILFHENEFVVYDLGIQ